MILEYPFFVGYISLFQRPRSPMSSGLPSLHWRYLHSGIEYLFQHIRIIPVWVICAVIESFSDLKVLSWRQAIKCEGVFLTRKNPLSPQSTAWRQTLSNIVLNGQPWVTMTTASGKVSTVPLREKNVVQGQTRRLWRSQILFLSQSCHWTAAKIWASLGQMSLPASFRGSHQDCPCLFFLS